MSDFGVVTEPGTVRIERLLPAPVEGVWTYLSDPQKRGTWLASGPMELRVGGNVELQFDHARLSAEPTPERFREYMNGHTVRGRITACEPLKSLSFTWGDSDTTISEVSFVLTPRGEQTHLVLTQRRLANRNETVSVASGWHTHLGILDDQLQGRVPRPFWSTHTALETEYEKRVP
jgi:uncharacterized protein YndB with AHSA1/START domain